MPSTPSHTSVVEVLIFLRDQSYIYTPPLSDLILEEHGPNPFFMLIGCLLSLRARDSMTYPVSQKLFSLVKTPQELLSLPLNRLTEILRPIGFYNKKAAILQEVCRYLMEVHKGQVPETHELLIKIPGVGQKTTAFLLSYVFNTPALCVDTHVHRLANCFGWVHTKTVAQTESALSTLIPLEWWSKTNSILVRWGQHVCPPRLSKSRKAFHDTLCPCAHKGKVPPTNPHGSKRYSKCTNNTKVT